MVHVGKGLVLLGFIDFVWVMEYDCERYLFFSPFSVGAMKDLFLVREMKQERWKTIISVNYFVYAFKNG
jgi:hypothetical protein